MRKLNLALIALFLLVVGAVPALAQTDDAHLRVAHLSVDAGEVDVYIDGEVTLSGVAFGTVSNWMLVPAGTYSIAVSPAGTSVDEAVIGPVDVTAAPDSWYTVAAIGTATSDVAELTAQVIEEDYSPIELGQTRVTVFHAIPNANPVSLVAGEDNVLVAGLAYPAGDNDGLTTLNLDAGTYDLQVRLTEDPEAVVFDLPGTDLGASRNIFIAAAGLAEDPELVFISTDPDEVDGAAMEGEDEMAGGDANLRVAHLSTDAGEVDVYVNGELSEFTGVTYPALSDWVTVPAGTYEVAVAPAGTSIEDAVIGPVDVSVSGGEWYTVAAIGYVEDETLTAQVIVEDYSEIPPGQARFTVFHASAGAQPVDVLVNGEPFVQTLAFPGTQGDNDGTVSFTVLGGEYDIEVTANNDPETVLLSAENFNMQPGSHYFIAAINRPQNIALYIQTLSADELFEVMQ